MRAKLIKLTLIFSIMIASLLMVVMPAYAATSVDYNGTLGVDTVSAWFNGCTAAYEDMNFHAQPFYVDADGSYTLETIAATGMPVVDHDTHIALYTPSFNAGDYTENCIAHNDDTNGFFPEINRTLSANVQYYLVTLHAYSGSAPGATFTNRIAGAGNITLGLLPVPTTAPTVNVIPSDGRLNSRLGDIDAVIYPGRDGKGDTAMHVYCVNQLSAEGFIAMVITQDDLPENPVSENTLLLQSDTCEGTVEFYALAAGGQYAYQVNVGPGIEGTVHEYLFNDINGEDLVMRTFNLYELGD